MAARRPIRRYRSEAAGDFLAQHHAQVASASGDLWVGQEAQGLVPALMQAQSEVLARRPAGSQASVVAAPGQAAPAVARSSLSVADAPRSASASGRALRSLTRPPARACPGPDPGMCRSHGATACVRQCEVRSRPVCAAAICPAPARPDTTPTRALRTEAKATKGPKDARRDRPGNSIRTPEGRIPGATGAPTKDAPDRDAPQPPHAAGTWSFTRSGLAVRHILSWDVMVRRSLSSVPACARSRGRAPLSTWQGLAKPRRRWPLT